jgi:hypothetical protein
MRQLEKTTEKWTGQGLLGKTAEAQERKEKRKRQVGLHQFRNLPSKGNSQQCEETTYRMR